MTPNHIVKRPVEHLSKTTRYVNRKTKAALNEAKELSEVQSEMREADAREADRAAVGTGKTEHAISGANGTRCARCGRKIEIPDYCTQCGLDMGRGARIKRQKRVRDSQK